MNVENTFIENTKMLLLILAITKLNFTGRLKCSKCRFINNNNSLHCTTQTLSHIYNVVETFKSIMQNNSSACEYSNESSSTVRAELPNGNV